MPMAILNSRSRPITPSVRSFASAVGYEAFRTDLASLNTASLTIQLEPTAYDIGEVSVSANSFGIAENNPRCR